MTKIDIEQLWADVDAGIKRVSYKSLARAYLEMVAAEEGAYAIIAAERAEVIKLRRENERLREAYDALNDISRSGGLRHATEEQELRLENARAALAKGTDT